VQHEPDKRMLDAHKGHRRSQGPTGLRRLFVDVRGSVTTEYAVVVGVCGIVIAAAVASLGVPLITGYNNARAILISPAP
jgi:hypothetical protein